MDTVLNFFSYIADFIRNSATDISKTFTGADSGAVFVAIIFYLIILLAFILLLKMLVRAFKTLLKEINLKKNKNTNKEEPSVTVPDVNNEKTSTVTAPAKVKSEPQVLFDGFDGKKLLSALTEKYNFVKDTSASLVDHDRVDSPSTLLPIDGKKKTVTLSAAEKEEIKDKISGDNLAELLQLLNNLNDEAVVFDSDIAALNDSLSEHCQLREKLVEEELLALNEYNSVVDEVNEIKRSFDSSKTVFAIEYSHLFNFVSELESEISELLEKNKKINNDILIATQKVEGFISSCESTSQDYLKQFSQKEALVFSLKERFASLNTARISKDCELLKMQSEIDNQLKNKLRCDETIALLKLRVEELTQIEKERLAKEAAERAAREDAERKAREEAERIAKAEAERKAREEAERLTREKAEAERLERERLAKEEAVRLEKERIEREEAERRAKEEAERLAREEAEQKAREQAELAAKAEAERLEKERLAKEQAETLAKERAEQKRTELVEKFEAERKVREEEDLSAQEKTRLAKDISPDDESDDFVDVSDVVEKVQKQSQNAYVLNYEDISPEMYKKLARDSQNRKINVMKAAVPGNTNLTDTTHDVPASSEQKSKENPSDVEPEVVLPVAEKLNVNNDGSEETAPVQKVDHMAELKKQWAAEKAHKQEWAAEKARMKAEEERRKKELAESQAETTSNN